MPGFIGECGISGSGDILKRVVGHAGLLTDDTKSNFTYLRGNWGDETRLLLWKIGRLIGGFGAEEGMWMRGRRRRKFPKSFSCEIGR